MENKLEQKIDVLMEYKQKLERERKQMYKFLARKNVKT